MAKYDAGVLISHLKKKWADRPCCQCGVANWQVQDAVFELRQFSEGSLVVGGPIIPVVPVTCANCGNTLLVNAIRAGIIDQPTEAEK